MIKREIDIAASFLGLLLLSPLLVAVAALIKLDSAGPVFFKQERIGRGFRPFFIYKFRTMVADAPRLGRAITAGEDPRITRVGRFLRRFKLDELPQLINVLKGEMSLVGPRPEVPKYVELFREDYQQILSVRPGVTDPASLEFIAEAELLAEASDPEREYVAVILPRKIELARKYLRERSLAGDIKLLFRTLRRLF